MRHRHQRPRRLGRRLRSGGEVAQRARRHADSCPVDHPRAGWGSGSRRPRAGGVLRHHGDGARSGGGGGAGGKLPHALRAITRPAAWRRARRPRPRRFRRGRLRSARAARLRGPRQRRHLPRRDEHLLPQRITAAGASSERLPRGDAAHARLQTRAPSPRRERVVRPARRSARAAQRLPRPDLC